MTSFEEILDLLLENIPLLEIAKIPLSDAAGYILAEDIKISKKDIPTFAKGYILEPQKISLLAAIGKEQVTVYKKPNVSVIAINDKGQNKTANPNNIDTLNGNLFSVISKIKSTQTECNNLGVVSINNKNLLYKKVGEKTGTNILIIITEDTSTDLYKKVVAILKELKVEQILDKIPVENAELSYFGKIENRRIFWLHCNVLSCFISFELLIKPFLELMCGSKYISYKIIKMKLSGNLKNTSNKSQFIPGKIKSTKDEIYVEPIVSENISDNIFILTNTDCFIIVSPDTTLENGTIADIILTRSFNNFSL